MTERDTRDEEIDEASAESFPASDPPSNTGETGIRLDITNVSDDQVVDNRAAHRFELEVDGLTAVLNYQRNPDSLVLVHTEVPPSLRGRHIGDTLIRVGLATAKREGLQVIPVCPFVQAYLRRHREAK